MGSCWRGGWVAYDCVEHAAHAVLCCVLVRHYRLRPGDRRAPELEARQSLPRDRSLVEILGGIGEKAPWECALVAVVPLDIDNTAFSCRH